MAKIVYGQMPAPQELPQQMPAPRAKSRMQKPQGGSKFLVQILGGERGGMVMDEIDTCIISESLYTSIGTRTGNGFSVGHIPVLLKNGSVYEVINSSCTKGKGWGWDDPPKDF